MRYGRGRHHRVRAAAGAGSSIPHSPWSTARRAAGAGTTSTSSVRSAGADQWPTQQGLTPVDAGMLDMCAAQLRSLRKQAGRCRVPCRGAPRPARRRQRDQRHLTRVPTAPLLAWDDKSGPHLPCPIPPRNSSTTPRRRRGRRRRRPPHRPRRRASHRLRLPPRATATLLRHGRRERCSTRCGDRARAAPRATPAAPDTTFRRISQAPPGRRGTPLTWRLRARADGAFPPAAGPGGQPRPRRPAGRWTATRSLPYATTTPELPWPAATARCLNSRSDSRSRSASTCRCARRAVHTAGRPPDRGDRTDQGRKPRLELGRSDKWLWSEAEVSDSHWTGGTGGDAEQRLPRAEFSGVIDRWEQRAHGLVEAGDVGGRGPRRSRARREPASASGVIGSKTTSLPKWAPNAPARSGR